MSLWVHHVTVESIGWYLERLSGDWEAAERELRRGYEALSALNETGVLASAAGYLAHCMVAQGRDGEAEQFIAACVESAARDDVVAQILWRQARAKLLARRGELAEAELVSRETVELARPTDAVELHGDVLFQLAEVLTVGGKHEEAHMAAESARDLYDRKEYLVGASRARELLEQVDAELTVPVEP
jgi:tetratricopeptide (TPR) repeat protein